MCSLIDAATGARPVGRGIETKRVVAGKTDVGQAVAAGAAQLPQMLALVTARREIVPRGDGDVAEAVLA